MLYYYIAPSFPYTSIDLAENLRVCGGISIFITGMNMNDRSSLILAPINFLCDLLRLNGSVRVNIFVTSYLRDKRTQ